MLVAWLGWRWVLVALQKRDTAGTSTEKCWLPPVLFLPPQNPWKYGNGIGSGHGSGVPTCCRVPGKNPKCLDEHVFLQLVGLHPCFRRLYLDAGLLASCPPPIQYDLKTLSQFRPTSILPASFKSYTLWNQQFAPENRPYRPQKETYEYLNKHQFSGAMYGFSPPPISLFWDFFENSRRFWDFQSFP